MKIFIKQEHYSIPPVMKALKREGFKWNSSKGGFEGIVTNKNKRFLTLLGYIK